MTISVGTNSYISIADATTYFAESLVSDTWTALDSTTQEQALVTAYRMLERNVWAGAKTVPTQTQSWPRTGVTDKDGNAVDSSSIPQQILDAQCELALAIQQDYTVLTSAGMDQNIKKITAGPVDVEYFRPTKGQRFPTVVQSLIAAFYGNVVPAGLVSGNCDQSAFDPCNPYNNYGVVQGFS